ncbi:hypothetical protein [Thermomonospora amylolytica]|uniref:hypothetical protein n=1 Tax=Thermomonospora amylolytica TaxID=1411117 RepID=UPI000E6D2226|nr:hypothetical protein [Thermomonospora amylolytica]
MAQSSWPDPAAGRVVNDRQYELLAARFSDDGLYGVHTDPAPVVGTGAGLTVTVKAGLYGSVRGHGWTSGDTDYTHTLDGNTSGQTRIDRVVLRLDRSTWQVRTAIRKGDPGSGAPALVRDEGPAGVWEVPLARVTVAHNAAAIGAGDVVARPMYVGSRIRHQHSQDRDPNPMPGAINWDYDTGRWVGWNGQWRTLGPPQEATYTLSPAAGWTADPNSTNAARTRDDLVMVDLNFTWNGGTISEDQAHGRLVTTVPAAVRPTFRRAAAVVLSGDRYGQLHVQPNGRVEYWHSNGGLANGVLLRATFSYLL